ncbi:MAG: TAXI family TRAP transporter solute-binding subunit [Alphaproteobacteria bacterium]|nr:TAXI family TRAP transporter solute-binding subunit [Alphaproteobacteria bacterium]
MTCKRLIIAAAVMAVAAVTAQAQTLSIGTSPVGTLNYSTGNALGKVMTDSAGLRARVVPFGGGQHVLPLIGRKELELSISTATDTINAFEGKEDFKGKPNPSLRAIGKVFPFAIGWYVKKDSPYKTLTDLKGKKIAVGFTASSAQERFFRASFATYGVTEKDFDGVQAPHVVRGADDFMQGKVEASTFAVGAGKIAEANAKVGGLRFLNVPDSADAIKRLRTVLPRASVSVLNPAPQFAGIVAPTKLIFEDYLVVGGTQISDGDAYKLAKVLYEEQAKLAGIAKTYEQYKTAELGADRGVPFHPGAMKYYKEKGIWKGN